MLLWFGGFGGFEGGVEGALLWVAGGVGVLRAEIVERDADFFFCELVPLVESVVSRVM